MLKLSIGLVALVMAAPASAEPVAIKLNGDFYDGGPSYEIQADGKTLEAGEIVSRSDTTITVDVVDISTLKIRFTNDAFGPAGTADGRDRNLIVRSIESGGEIWLGKDLASGTESGVRGDSLVIYANATVGLPLDDAPSSIANSSETKAGMAPTCSPQIEVINFANGSVQPDKVQAAKLGSLLADKPGCAVRITGYSSTAGSSDANELISLARAQAVLEYLKQNGASFTSEEVVGFGETDQFGSPADNRRVVVELR